MQAKTNSLKKLLITTAAIIPASVSLAQETSPVENPGISDLGLFFILCAFILAMVFIIFVLSGAIKSLAENKKLWEKKNNIPSVIIAFLLCLGANSSFAQNIAESASAPIIVMDQAMLYTMLSIIGLLFIIILVLANTFKMLLKEIKTIEANETKEEPSFFRSIENSLTDAKPIEQEHEILLDHDYDGIRELDNNLPPWWKYGFYLTIVFSFIYLIHYHITQSGDLQEAEYQKELILAEQQKAEFMKLAANQIDENNVVKLDGSGISNGKEIFSTNCAACHGQSGEGGVGPNLTDNYWLHGGGIKNVFKAVKYGIPQKGMIAWQTQLTPRQMQEVSSFILSLKNTNPVNSKEPQGDLIVE